MCEVGTSQAPTRTFGQCVQRAGKAVVWHMLSGSHESAISRGQHRLRAIQHDTFMRAQTKSSQVASQVKSSQVKSSQGDEVTEGDDGGARGCEGVEQGAPMTACEAEGSDEDEAMAGKENVPVQRADGGSGLTGGIKKVKRGRGKRKGGGHRRRHPATGADLRLAADEASVS